MKLYERIMLLSAIVGITSCGGLDQGKLKDKKYDTEKFTLVDTLNIDTTVEKPNINHLYNYVVLGKEINLDIHRRFKILKEDIEFKTDTTTKDSEIVLGGLLKVRKEEFYIKELIGKKTHKKEIYISKLIDLTPKEISSLNNLEKIKEMNYTINKRYSLDNNLEINEVRILGRNYDKEKGSSFIFDVNTPDTERGRKVLYHEKKSLDEYLIKILNHKNLND